MAVRVHRRHGEKFWRLVISTYFMIHPSRRWTNGILPITRPVGPPNEGGTTPLGTSLFGAGWAEGSDGQQERDDGSTYRAHMKNDLPQFIPLFFVVMLWHGSLCSQRGAARFVNSFDQDSLDTIGSTTNSDSSAASSAASASGSTMSSASSASRNRLDGETWDDVSMAASGLNDGSSVEVSSTLGVAVLRNPFKVCCLVVVLPDLVRLRDLVLADAVLFRLGPA